jgi:hypothetical protein
VHLYQAPLAIGAPPIKILRTIGVHHGRSLTLGTTYGIGASAHSEFRWISEPSNHFVIRVRGHSPITR